MRPPNWPRYPIYIPSKGRHATPLTMRALARESVPHTVVVEPAEYDAYVAACPGSAVVALPFSGRGLIASRNWIKDHATAAGHVRHWQLDDNLRGARRLYRGRRCYCPMRVALAMVETFVDRYTNIAIAGPNYDCFAVPATVPPPFHLNGRVYSCSLVLNAVPHRWRAVYNDDTDLCLQVLADGWCTVLVNAFAVAKTKTMQLRGGNTPIYTGDGRLAMARSLERDWPGVVTVTRRFQRPQHVVNWSKFDTRLIRRPDVEWSSFDAIDERGLALRDTTPRDHDDGRHP